MGGMVQRATRFAVAAVVVGIGSTDLWAQGADATCKKEDFEAVVEATASSLRDLNSKNRPEFQEKLRELKAKRNWTQNEFMEKAAPFVRDDKTAVYDKSTDELLSAISSMGQEGARAATPDCAILLELRARMKILVDTQTAKWGYMFEKLDAELAK
ncbi:hypothetical protein HYPDE_29823 [Hyphomicrobium denitrificans 1NES1]|uniref:Uncharacterized protein n=1 Tax=Hyphomicrobium denitrificans 1NES1 TaxID=670307 RepID=N0B2B2_9HYPH|nr:hypothetical protein HYPDE_29823 [Hyphomicrobium denitrificans 1NES1]